MLTPLTCPSAPSVESRAAASRELLLAALEDLSEEQLKRFRHKLRDAPLKGRSIPWGRLERADAVDLAEQLTQFYGPEPALDVARKTLKRADIRDVAARLKEQRLQRELGVGGRPGPCPSVPSSHLGRVEAPGLRSGVLLRVSRTSYCSPPPATAA